MNNYIVFTDGSSSRKNRSIGFSYVIFKDSEKQYQQNAFGFSDIKSRNGLAELLALYSALEFLMIDSSLKKKKDVNITIYSDSQYVVNEINLWCRDHILKNFIGIKHQEIIIHILYILHILRECDKFRVVLKWVKGHQKEKSFEQFGNDLADQYAVNVHKGQLNLPNVENLIDDIRECINKEKEFEYIKKWYLGI